MATTAMDSNVDPRLTRGLWQLGILGGIGAALAISAGAPALPFGPAAWLVAAPALALAMAYRQPLRAWVRRRPETMTFVLEGASNPRASVPLLSRGARDATDRNSVPVRRAARQQRRSPRHEQRSQPVAGRG